MSYTERAFEELQRGLEAVSARDVATAPASQRAELRSSMASAAARSLFCRVPRCGTASVSGSRIRAL